jgi:hypothetical protein
MGWQQSGPGITGGPTGNESCQGMSENIRTRFQDRNDSSQGRNDESGRRNNSCHGRKDSVVSWVRYSGQAGMTVA